MKLRNGRSVAEVELEVVEEQKERPKKRHANKKSKKEKVVKEKTSQKRSRNEESPNPKREAFLKRAKIQVDLEELQQENQFHSDTTLHKAVQSIEQNSHLQNSLPMELLHHILQYVFSVKELIHFASTCKYLYISICYNNDSWKRFLLSRDESLWQTLVNLELQIQKNELLPSQMQETNIRYWVQIRNYLYQHLSTPNQSALTSITQWTQQSSIFSIIVKALTQIHSCQSCLFPDPGIDESGLCADCLGLTREEEEQQLMSKKKKTKEPLTLDNSFYKGYAMNLYGLNEDDLSNLQRRVVSNPHYRSKRAYLYGKRDLRKLAFEKYSKLTFGLMRMKKALK